MSKLSVSSITTRYSRNNYRYVLNYILDDFGSEVPHYVDNLNTLETCYSKCSDYNYLRSLIEAGYSLYILGKGTLHVPSDLIILPKSLGLEGPSYCNINLNGLTVKDFLESKKFKELEYTYLMQRIGYSTSLNDVYGYKIEFKKDYIYSGDSLFIQCYSNSGSYYQYIVYYLKEGDPEPEFNSKYANANKQRITIIGDNIPRSNAIQLLLNFLKTLGLNEYENYQVIDYGINLYSYRLISYYDAKLSQNIIVTPLIEYTQISYLVRGLNATFNHSLNRWNCKESPWLIFSNKLPDINSEFKVSILNSKDTMSITVKGETYIYQKSEDYYVNPLDSKYIELLAIDNEFNTYSDQEYVFEFKAYNTVDRNLADAVQAIYNYDAKFAVSIFKSEDIDLGNIFNNIVNEFDPLLINLVDTRIKESLGTYYTSVGKVNNLPAAINLLSKYLVNLSLAEPAKKITDIPISKSGSPSIEYKYVDESILIEDYNFEKKLNFKLFHSLLYNFIDLSNEESVTNSINSMIELVLNDLPRFKSIKLVSHVITVNTYVATIESNYDNEKENFIINFELYN